MNKSDPAAGRDPSPAFAVEIYDTEEDWLAARDVPPDGRALFSIGSSEISHVLGIPGTPNGALGSTYMWMLKNPEAKKRFADEIEALEERRNAGNQVNLAARKRLEPDVREMVTDHFDLAPRLFDPGDLCIVRSAAYPWLAWSPDLLVRAGASVDLEKLGDRWVFNAERLRDGSIDGHVEMKTVHTHQAHRWPLDLPAKHVLVQAHTPLVMPELEHWREVYVGAFVCYGEAETEQLVYQFGRLEHLASQIVEDLEQFAYWIERDELPPPDGCRGTAEALRAMYPPRPSKEEKEILLPATPIEISGEEHTLPGLHAEFYRNKEELDRLKRRQRQIGGVFERVMIDRDARTAKVPACDETPDGGNWTRFTTRASAPKHCPNCAGVTDPGGKTQSKCYPTR